MQKEFIKCISKGVRGSAVVDISLFREICHSNNLAINRLARTLFGIHEIRSRMVIRKLRAKYYDIEDRIRTTDYTQYDKYGSRRKQEKEVVVEELKEPEYSCTSCKNLGYECYHCKWERLVPDIKMPQHFATNYDVCFGDTINKNLA